MATSLQCASPSFSVQVAILLPLFVFCWFMYNWETDEADQVPILPVEGEELPCNIKGPRLLREANFLQSLETKLAGAGAIAARGCFWEE